MDAVRSAGGFFSAAANSDPKRSSDSFTARIPGVIDFYQGKGRFSAARLTSGAEKPPTYGFSCPRVIASKSQARAKAQCRSAVAREMPSSSAACSSVRPAK